MEGSLEAQRSGKGPRSLMPKAGSGPNNFHLTGLKTE